MTTLFLLTGKSPLGWLSRPRLGSASFSLFQCPQDLPTRPRWQEGRVQQCACAVGMAVTGTAVLAVPAYAWALCHLG